MNHPPRYLPHSHTPEALTNRHRPWIPPMMSPDHAEPQIALYIGDCAVVLPRLDLRASLILTSPPYDGLRHYGGHPFDFPAVAQACVDALAPGGVLVWIVTDGTTKRGRTGNSMRQALHFMDLGLLLHDHMVYQRLGLFNRTPVRYCPTWDHMFVLSNGPPRIVHLLDDRPNATAGRRTINYNNGFGRRPDGAPSDPRTTHRLPTITPSHGIRTNIWPYPVGGNGNQTGDPAHTSQHPAPFPLALAREPYTQLDRPGRPRPRPHGGIGHHPPGRKGPAKTGRRH